MRLSELLDLDSFALLGPGFGGGACVLLADLREGGQGEQRLVYTPFEGEAGSARTFSAGGARALARGADEPLEMNVPPRELEARLDEGDYARDVERIREAIAAGDVYQVCHTVRSRVGAASGAELFTGMSARGLARFAAWVRLPGGPEFVSASPELFFETDGRAVHSEPMKGTARPGAGGELEASEKDRAELAMITDLVRNDLVPVCRPRTVRVACERRVVELPYALQTVSDVVGELAEDITPLDVLDALHPGGSVVGTPKRAALAMIRDLEPGPRGAYCGAMGVCREGRSVFSLLIRTAERRPEGWVYGVGGGIVYESDAGRELEELRVKLGALRCRTPC